MVWYENLEVPKKVIKYILMQRNKLKVLGHVAQEYLERQGRPERHYDKDLKAKQFNIGDQVLLLLLTKESKQVGFPHSKEKNWASKL